ncbi:NADH-quinone oxidoreductase subunit J [candidate division KSB1 bacterium]|nr:NADH-quinone oxidoreductase subunit J [candidate division KSB1 bacterium]
MIAALFFAFAAVAVAGAILMVVHRNPVYSALFLILTLFAIAGLFVLLNAPFIAAVHVIVYAGAIMVLFLFVVLLMDLEEERVRRHRLKLAQILGIVAAAVLLVEVGVFLKAGFAGAATQGPDGSQIIGDTESIGRLLFTEYLFPFEVASVLLLSGIIGSVLLAKLKLRS